MIKRELNPEQGNRLKECLEDIRMAQKELAQKSGYTQQYISNIVVGKKNMSHESADIFSQILGIKKEYLLCESDFKNRAEEQKSSIDWELNKLSALDNLLDQLGYYIETIAEYQNLETGEIITIDDNHGLPEDHEDTGPVIRDIGNEVVYEYEGETICQNIEEFENCARPKYKRISENYILYVYAKKTGIKLNKEQRDAFISEIIDYIDYRVNRFL